MRPTSELTKQEHQVLKRVATGRPNAKIAQDLHISIRTVESHLYRIFQKLNVSSRTEAAIFAFDIGWLSKLELSGITDDRRHGSGYLRS